ncbi:MAG: glucose-6-phosphate isomerase [Pseudomonadota bacterium]
MPLAHWNLLTDHANELRDVHLRNFFEDDSDRFNKFSIKSNSLLVDFSKNRINQQTHSLLLELAREAEVEAWRDKMFAGEIINNTEQRAVLHTALLNPANSQVSTEIEKELAHMEELCNKLHSGQWRGYKNTPIKDVVVIGIGGSYLGPKVACEALHSFATTDINIHFVANVDAHVMNEVLTDIDPESTLFVVISKSFSTQETKENSITAASWLTKQSGDQGCIRKQFIAITSNFDAAKAFGVADENILSMWDWVGGRYSLWSTVGFPVALCIGMNNFRELLAGAHSMDEHFRKTPLNKNIPVTLGLIGIWNINFLNSPHHAVLPYDHRLRSLPGYLQQLDMESNGKRVTRDGNDVDYVTGPILFGEAGTNGQHAFHQLLHQGKISVPCDFIGFANAQHPYDHHHEILLANMLAQAQAMMIGRTREETESLLVSQGQSTAVAKELAPHMTFPGNRPSNTLLAESLTPHTLGELLAMYEHKIFVQGVIWNINSFDQMGVELGKTLTGKILPELRGQSSAINEDSSTRGLIEFLQRFSE